MTASAALVPHTTLATAWLWLRDLWRVVWTCRVSVASVLAGAALMSTEQGRDLFADRTADTPIRAIAFWFLFYAGAIVLWAIPVHLSARWILNDEHWLADGSRTPLNAQISATLRARFAGKVTLVPRLLGYACFAVILYGQIGAIANLYPSRTHPVTEATVVQLRWLMVATVAAAFVFRVYLVRRRTAARQFSEGTTIALDPAMRTQIVKVTPYVLAIVPLIALLWSIIDPVGVSERFPRAQFLVLLVGSWVPVLTLLAALSYRIKAPVLLLTFIALGTLSFVFGDIHDMRTLTRSAGAPSTDRHIDLHAAVTLWRAANGCAPLDTSGTSLDLHAAGPNAPPCAVRPILVTASGGASRAAFHTVGVLGRLLDISHGQASATGLRDFGTQLFSISGVSGGALGAVVFAAALEDGRINDPASERPRPPCRSTTADTDPYTTLDTSWRACLQALIAGDFLSAGFVGLVFRDPIVPRGVDDRAALLERTWEAHYRAVVGTTTLERPFSSLRPGEQRWRPLLILNGTSVTDGRRVLLSHLATRAGQLPDDGSPRYPHAIFQGVYDLDDLLNDGAVCPPREVRLSTAATVSARFPVVSPHGTIRDCADRVVERVVDGGYFENDGATTTEEIAWALREFYGLHPIVIHIRNAPLTAAAIEARNRAQWRKPEPPESSLPFALFSAPLRSLIATRTGRAETAVRSLIWQVDDRVDPVDYYAFEVYDALERPVPPEIYLGCPLAGEAPAPRMQQVSMSWWMSAAVQAYLDAQLCDRRNAAGLSRIIDVLRRTPPP